MTSPTLHEPPRGLPVFRLQILRLGRLLRPETIGLAVLLGMVVVFGLIAAPLDARATGYPQGLNFLLPLLAFLIPFRIWHGERLFDGAPLWTLPVERGKHALLIVAAGAVWVALLSVSVIAAFTLLALASGGSTASEGLDLALAGNAAPQVSGFRLWLCLVPVGGALVAYAFASALVVGLRYPLRWAVGLFVAAILLAGIALEFGLQSMISELVYGSLGLDRLLTGGVLGFSVHPQDARATPTAAGWILALSFWAGLGLIAVAIASARHRER